jgi:anti-sigma regulatory factor (Ser/Thr protein kinase)
VVGALLSDIRPDDVAVIAARMTPPRERLTGTWPADRRVLAGIRQLLRRWLRFQGANPDEVYDLTVAVQEACANAIEHAYRPGAQSFALDASANSGHVRIVVRDHGRWREPRGGRGRGRGLVLMRALTDVTEVLDGEEGTEVVLERSLGSRVAA